VGQRPCSSRHKSQSVRPMCPMPCSRYWSSPLVQQLSGLRRAPQQLPSQLLRQWFIALTPTTQHFHSTALLWKGGGLSLGTMWPPSLCLVSCAQSKSFFHHGKIYGATRIFYCARSLAMPPLAKKQLSDTLLLFLEDRGLAG
jgi:hypothetical protein